MQRPIFAKSLAGDRGTLMKLFKKIASSPILILVCLAMLSQGCGRRTYPPLTLPSGLPSSGPSSLPSTSPTPAQIPTPFPPSSVSIFDQISLLAERSDCSRANWRDRGSAPMGYIKGLAISYARSFCRFKMGSPIGQIMASANTDNTFKDALAYYGFRTNPGIGALRAVYTLGIGLGMRESSGSYCEGWDRSAGSNRPSSAAEAGAFQMSYDAISATPELRALYDEYRASPERCLLDVFKEGAHCRHSTILGTGEGAAFQAFNLSCPAFATEFAMISLRVNRRHFGPINRKEAQVLPACSDLVQDVEALILTGSNACEDLR